MSFVGDAIGKVAGGLGIDKVLDAGKDLLGGITGKTAADAAESAARTQAAAQMEALEYLKEREALPQEFREGSLGILGGLYGLGDTRGAARTLERSPLFEATMGLIPEQEEAILRNQSATGALRSGGTEAMLAENQRTNKLQAYMNALQPLQGLAGLQSMAPQIAQGISGIGQTQAQGQIGAAQARQQGIGNMMGMGMNALALAGFSDIRLKDNIQPAGKRFGHDWYTWEWNETAKELGLSGEAEGVLAQDIVNAYPDAIGMSKGYLTVDYEKLGLA